MTAFASHPWTISTFAQATFWRKVLPAPLVRGLFCGVDPSGRSFSRSTFARGQLTSHCFTQQSSHQKCRYVCKLKPTQQVSGVGIRGRKPLNNYEIKSYHDSASFSANDRGNFWRHYKSLNGINVSTWNTRSAAGRGVTELGPPGNYSWGL